MYFGFFCLEDAPLQLVVAVFELGTNAVPAQFSFQRLGHVKLVFGNGQNAHLVGSQPEREIARIMLNQKSKEALMSPQRGSMDA